MAPHDRRMCIRRGWFHSSDREVLSGCLEYKNLDCHRAEGITRSTKASLDLPLLLSTTDHEALIDLPGYDSRICAAGRRCYVDFGTFGF